MTRALFVGVVAACACADPTGQGPVDYDQLGPAARAREEARRNASRTLPTAPADAQAWAEQAASEAGRGLKKRLQSAMKSGGPVEAITACNLQAPTVMADIAEIRGVRVGRTSVRLRNPANGSAPDWVKAWLDKHGSTPAADAPVVSAIASAADGTTVARVLRPLPVEPVCLTCHGPEDTLAAPVRERLASLYPADTAFGYEAGDLRGVLWAEYAFATGD